MGVLELGRTPETALLCAVVVQAVTDLDSPDALVRREANSFFTAHPPSLWAESRKTLFDALGLDEGKVLEALASKLTAPTRPVINRRVDYAAFLDSLPPGLLSVSVLAESAGISPIAASTRLKILRDKGWVVPAGRGVYLRAPTGKQEPVKAGRFRNEVTALEDVRRIVFDLLAIAPRTFKDLIIATNGDVADAKIRQVLNSGIIARELDRDPATNRYFVPQSGSDVALPEVDIVLFDQ